MAEEDLGPMEGTATLLLSFSSTVADSLPMHAPTVWKTTGVHPSALEGFTRERPHLEFVKELFSSFFPIPPSRLPSFSPLAVSSEFFFFFF